LEKEEEQIIIHNSFNDGFNLVEKPTNNMLGYRHTEEAKEKMSKIRKAAGRATKNGSLSDEQVRELRQKYFDGERITVLAKEYGLNRKNIRECVTLKSYKDIPCEIEGYTEMLEKLKADREQGIRTRSRGWNHNKEFIEKFTKAVSKPRPADKRALTPDQVRAIRHKSKLGATLRVLAEEFNVNQNSISRIIRKITYKDIT
jgi:DNA-binding transcriptional regulator YiaG